MLTTPSWVACEADDGLWPWMSCLARLTSSQGPDWVTGIKHTGDGFRLDGTRFCWSLQPHLGHRLLSATGLGLR